MKLTINDMDIYPSSMSHQEHLEVESLASTAVATWLAMTPWGHGARFGARVPGLVTQAIRFGFPKLGGTPIAGWFRMENPSIDG